MLVNFPIGLWIFSLVCDLIGSSVAAGEVCFIVAFYAMVGGLIGALVAAMPGFIDLSYHPGGGPPSKKITLTHMTIKLSAVVLYALNIDLHTRGHASMEAPIILSATSVCTIAVSVWLGGYIVHVYRVGVEGRD